MSFFVISSILTSAQMTVIRGRKRIGKTELLRRATEGQTTLYFFVSRKVEPFLCQDLREEVANKLGVEIIGEINNFSSFFEYLMILSKDRPFNLIIDEIQEFMHINPHVFFSIQKYWNKHKDKSRINILITGSADNLMTNIFENSKEPMFECPTNRIELQPFTTGVIKEILAKYHPQYTPEDLLSFYSITGG
ncbi:ATP-binding protein, partial [Odoribacter sp. OttesenSCG-928-A06]|nr:ATP-binding protein [Odoribacter sp. OttesenSCG-928-A06]